MTIPEIIALVGGVGGLLGLGVFGAAQGTAPVVPPGPQSTATSGAARVTTHWIGSAGTLWGTRPEPVHAVAATIAEWARTRRRAPGARRDIRVLLVDDAAWTQWAVRRYGALGHELSVFRSTPQMVGAGMPMLVVRVQRNGAMVPWPEIVALICHETIHALEPHGGHRDPALWTAQSGGASVESRAVVRALGWT